MTGVTLDGFKLFAAIGQNRDLFAEAETAIDKAGSTILLSQLKSKSLTLDHVQRLRAAIGDDNFTLALDSLNESDLKKIIKKIDAFFAVGSSNAGRLRGQVAALAARRCELTLKPVKAAKKSAATKSVANTEASWTTAMSAKPKRRAS